MLRPHTAILMGVLGALAGAVFANACTGPGAVMPALPAPDAGDARVACEAAADTVVAYGRMHGLTCPEIKADLDRLIATVPACRAYFGDAGVAVVCE